MDNRREKLNQAVTELLEMPRDLVMDLPKLTVIGQEELYLDNHKGIMSFDGNLVRINLPRGFIEIEGSNLEIKTILPDELSICGLIRAIKYFQ
ncbi:MAG TPA: sporulation protein YqfC [Syntrophothermus lipocalidus]|uniref:Sporulation protein YqfC n=1 Tax=Syntrophothermus lipocalidus (strain DSM 12680 / TGB-C1) TaxID=643648 RepID=D7CNW6_SYNLT|nr:MULTISPECIES: sporulation protein YqfC [Syntrophothermus]ADI02401.1 sporulation protein YqfC [Syntrophothermus lipocalidus DSM 12680]NSW83267.1 sporulation protein YqfC [Syntrophothermus sp.]HHV77779.1 sporulation protein YqfC [Syntrophothermus lipocalidus]